MPVTTALAALLPAAGPMPALGPDWLNADHLIQSFGTYALIGIVVVVFIETGLLFPFLPGDSLLFTAGALVAQQQLDFPLWLLCALIFAAAFLGDQLAYFFGVTSGRRLFARPDSRIFKQKYIDQTYAYFDRYGGRTIIVARFVPIVRTYAPVAAGVGKMSYKHFVSFNVIGAAAWGVGITLLGYALGNITFVKDNIEALLVLIVLVSLVPMGVEVLRARRDARREAAAGGAAAGPVDRTDVERKAFDQ
ncbi:MAG TPA: VTT domain-containing protein [Cellulomonas sp.]